MRYPFRAVALLGAATLFTACARRAVETDTGDVTPVVSNNPAAMTDSTNMAADTAGPTTNPGLPGTMTGTQPTPGTSGTSDVTTQQLSATMPGAWVGSITAPASLAGPRGTTVTSQLTTRGTVTMQPAAMQGQTTVMVLVGGLTPGSTYPWFLHQGTCGALGPVFGSASAYPALNTDASGNASLTITLPVATPTDGSYAAAIHSPNDMSALVGCSDLAQPDSSR